MVIGPLKWYFINESFISSVNSTKNLMILDHGEKPLCLMGQIMISKKS